MWESLHTYGSYFSPTRRMMINFSNSNKKFSHWKYIINWIWMHSTSSDGCDWIFLWGLKETKKEPQWMTYKRKFKEIVEIRYDDKAIKLDHQQKLVWQMILMDCRSIISHWNFRNHYQGKRNWLPFL